MDKKTIFVKTSKGDDETTSKTSHLYGDIKRIMGLIDNKSTVAELTKRAAPSLRESLEETLQSLVDSGFIQDKDSVVSGVKISTPATSTNKFSEPQAKDSGEGLDFTDAARAPVDAQAKAKQEAAARERAEDEAARLRAEREATRISAELAAAEAKAKMEAEAQARAEAEVVRLKAEQEVARIKAELAAAEARAHAETAAARLKAEQEAQKIRKEQEAEQAKTRAEEEAAWLKAEQERTRIKAEQEAEKVRIEREAMRAKARVEAEEVARLKVEQQAEKFRVELEAVRAQERGAVQAKAQAEAEMARIKAKQEEMRALAELEAAQAKAIAEAEFKPQPEVAAMEKPDIAQAKTALSEENLADSAPQAKADGEQMRKLAQAQAKVWSAAEQRSKVQVQKNEVKPTAKQDAITPQVETVQRVARKPRKPMPWGKVGASLIGLIAAAVLLLPYIWPMQSYVAKIEQELSVKLHQPVNIGDMRATIFPRQKLELQNVSVGDNKQLQLDKVTLIFSLATLFSESKTIDIAEVDNLTFNSKYFDAALPWLQAAGSDPRYPLVRMVLQQVRVSDLGFDLPVFKGIVDFDKWGRLVKAVLNSEDGKLGVELKPDQSSWLIALKVRDGALPLLPQFIFSELDLSGRVNEQAASFDEVVGYLYSGRVTGNARLTWKNNWQAQVNLSAKNMELRDALPQLGVTGKLGGDTKLTLRGESLPALARMPRIEGSFSVKDGVIGKVDLVEIAQTSGRQGMTGGRTHFDELTGNFLADNNGLHLRQLKLSTAAMSVQGGFDVFPDKELSNRKLSGRMDIDLKIRADMGSVPLVITGTPTDLVLRVGR